MKSFKPLNHSGFTLMEIMLVVVIIGILAAAVLPSLVNQLPPIQRKTAKADIVTLENTLERYYLQNNDFPTTDQGLKALLEKPTVPPEPKNWVGPYLKKFPKDPWEHEYKYKSPGEHNSNGVDIWSVGKDGIEGNDDDVTNWDDKQSSTSSKP